MPNDDKLTFSIGGGRRNVYHRQVRFVPVDEKLKEKLDVILVKEQHEYYLDEADHWYTIGHENAHSLGPKQKVDKLGKYSDIIEENKADMAALSFLDKLTEIGIYTEKQRIQIIVIAVIENFLKSKPNFEQSHRVRSVMQGKFFGDYGAYDITPEGKIKVNIDKVIPAAKKMLEEIIRIQINNQYESAKVYINKYFVWTKEMQIIADKLKKVDKFLNGNIEHKLADYFIKSI